MFSGYNLKLTKDFFDKKPMDFGSYKKIGEQHLKTQAHKYKNDLKWYINKGIIYESELLNDIFPIINADIFISHSHKDKDLANALAGWLHDEFDLNVFIDSNIWGYSDELLDKINSQYSKRPDPDGGFLYDHRSCNIASQHVNLMLSIALQKMIDRAECVILLNTNNAITVFDDNNHRFNSTYSPWVYSEIICTQIVRKKPLLYYRNYSELIHASENDSMEYSSFPLELAYSVSLLHISKLSGEDLDKWADTYDAGCEYPLDALYSFKSPKELENAKLLAEKYKYDLKQLRAFFDYNFSIH